MAMTTIKIVNIFSIILDYLVNLGRREKLTKNSIKSSANYDKI